jgi:hypothetical protein
MNVLKLSAIFMISLVLTMPVAFAYFSNVIVKGNDGLLDLVREEDFLDITVDVYIDGDSDVTANQIIFITGLTRFDSCVGPNIDGTFTCTLVYPKDEAMQFLVNEYPVSIRADKDDNSTAASTIKRVSVDREPPVVSMFDANPKSTSSEDIKFNYRVNDYAYRIGDISKCSGILYLQLYTFDGDILERIDYTEKKCTDTGSITIENSKFSEGTNLVYIKAVDAFEQESDPIYVSFNIDRTPVKIEDLDIFDSYGEGLVYIGEEGAVADVSVKIIGTDLNKDSVFADFSELNVDREEYIEQAECDETEGNVTVCEWEYVEIMLDSTGSKDVKITADDVSGNHKETKLSYNFIYDIEGPIVTDITTGNVRGARNFAKATGNDFTARLVETGIGIEAQDIYLGIGRWSAGVFAPEPGFPIPADECVSGWTCRWNNVDIPHEGNFIAVISDISVDKLGNPVQPGYSADVVTDFTEPSLLNIKVTPIGGALPAFADYIKTYDTLNIEIEVDEDNILKEVYADFSSIIKGANKVVADSCDDANGTYICRWQTSPIDVEGYIDDYLTFYFTDQAGNTLEFEQPIEVFGVTEFSMDLWQSKVSCTPNTIDRQTTALINHKVYCHVGLESEDAEILSLNLIGCEGGATEILEEDPILFNDQAGSTDPYIKLVLRAEEMNYDALDFKCSLNIISKMGTQIGKYPELEEVDLRVKMYNMPLGTYGDGVQGLIDSSKDFAWYIGDWVEDLNELFTYGEKLCNTLNSLFKLFRTLGAIGAALDVSAKTAAASGVGTAASTKIDKVREKIQEAQGGIGYGAKEGWKKGLAKFCKFFSCRLFYDEWFKEKGGEETGAMNKLGQYQRNVLAKANWVAGGGKTGGVQVWANSATGFETRIQGGKLSPKESIVMSTLTLCLPGIVYNLNKLRQIQCMYVGCLQNNAAAGLPLRACEMQKHYASCKYWWGELFQILPFTGLINYFSGLIKQIFSTPLGFVDTALAFACEYQIKAKYQGGLANLCLINDLAGLVANVYKDLEGAGESWEIPDDYCDNI